MERECESERHSARQNGEGDTNRKEKVKAREVQCTERYFLGIERERGGGERNRKDKVKEREGQCIE